MSANISDKRQIDLLKLTRWGQSFNESHSLPLARLLLSQSDPLESLINRETILRDTRTFNLQLKGTGPRGAHPGPRVAQAATGRCCLFALYNVLRYDIVDNLNLGDFELSGRYLFFYDKLEKANHYLENILETRHEPAESRIVEYLSRAPVNDGGKWDMAVNLIRKYGILPETVVPESFSSSASAGLNKVLTAKLREYASNLRSNPDRELKEAYMAEVFNLLSVVLGTPPKPDEEVRWEYNDRDGQAIRWEGSPLDFYQQYGRREGFDPEQCFSLVNDPRNPYGKVYQVERLGNVWGSNPVRHVNAPISALEDAVVAAIRANTPIFLGCDSTQSSSRSLGIFDTDLYDLQTAFGFGNSLSKADRMRMGESRSTHAMVITAAHLDAEDRPIRYKLENSWGKEVGDKGWFVMTADWFREHVFSVVVQRGQAEKKWIDILDEGETVMLDPWDVLSMRS